MSVRTQLRGALLAAALSWALAAPAGAAEAWLDLDPPLWQAQHCDSLESYLEAGSLAAEDYIQRVDWMRDYLAARPEEDAGFDPAAYYNDDFWGTSIPAMPLDSWLDRAAEDWPGGYTEQDFYYEMKYDWLEGLWRDHADRLHWEALLKLYPQDYAAFDADAWFAGYFGGSLGLSKETYMDREGYTAEEEFRLSMFAFCVDGTYTMGPWGVAVDGTPVSFYPREEAYPVLWSGAEDVLWVPARAVGEALGYAVAYDAGSGQVSFVRPDRTAVFTLGATDYTVDGEARALVPEDPAYAENDRLYLPVPQLSDALGCTWAWNGPHSTVFLQTTDKD